MSAKRSQGIIKMSSELPQTPDFTILEERVVDVFGNDASVTKELDLR